MTDVFIKSQSENTLGDQRVAMLNAGNRIVASPTLGAGANALNAATAEAVGVSDIGLRGRTGIITDSALINGMSRPWLQGPMGFKAFANGLDVPLQALGGQTVNQRIQQIQENQAVADGNSLIPDWKQLWDAWRIDLTIRKVARPTVRELIYNMSDTPNASRTMNITEMLPHAVIFEENNGTGQSVRQAELRGGLLDTATQKIYAAALTFDLLAALFGENYTDTSINDAVARGENGLKDDLALAPIFAHSYVLAAQTPANTTTDATREELLYKTYQDAIKDLGERRDPVTQRLIDASGLILLTSPADARQAASVLGGGFPSSNNSGSYMSLEGQITRIIGYDPEVITGTSEVVSYTAVPTGKAYLIKPNRRMIIAIKRRLQLNVNPNPNPSTLAQEERAWWFCEAIFNEGIDHFIQEVTLPAW